MHTRRPYYNTITRDIETCNELRVILIYIHIIIYIYHT